MNMAATAAKADWRQKILTDLRQRNQYQTNTFSALIQSHNRLLESSESYRLANNRLTVEVERLRAELTAQHANGTGSGGVVGNGGSGRGGSNESVQALEQKVYRLQEELTEVHRKRSENAQQVIDLNNSLGEKEKLLASRDSRVKELEEIVKTLEKKCENAEQNFVEVSTANQVLLDESQALQMAYSSLEQNLRKLQEDNQELIARWMELKSKDADKMNEEHLKFEEAKRVKLKAELQKAATEQIDIPDISGPVIAFTVSVPNRPVQTFEAHDGEVLAVRFTPSGRLFATGGSDRKLKLWEVSAGKCECKNVLIGSNAGITSIDFDSEESMVLASSNDFASRVWSCSSQRLLYTLTGHSAKVLSAKFIGDANRVVSGSYDRTLKLWDLRSIACIRTIFAGSSCNDIAILDSYNVISAHFDKKIRFWDMRSDSNSQKEIVLDGKITSLDISADKRLLLACTRSPDNITLIELRTAVKTACLSADGFRVATDSSRVAFSPDGSYVVGGSQDGGVYVWDVNTGNLNTTLQAHKDSVLTAAWNPNGQAIVTCDKHKTVVYWSNI